MHFEGKAVVKAPVDKVWNFISTPESIAQCLPGVEEYKVLDGKRTEAKLKIGVGFIKGRFKVNSRVLEEDPVNHRAKLLIDGSGVTSAFKAEIQISCNPHPEGSELAWIAEATVSGPLGSVAKGLIENASQKVINQTLECVTNKVSGSSS
ncbi:MAG: carbon monoxide dehydrogenase subunit G [Candidatus Bathyarchaeia archaeon]|jgi:carbon monoxide dehydrogenase subunit G